MTFHLLLEGHQSIYLIWSTLVHQVEPFLYNSIFVCDIINCLSMFYLLYDCYVLDNCVMYSISIHIVVTLTLEVSLGAALTNWSIFQLTTVQVRIMVDTRSAGLSESQAISSMVKTETGSHDDELQPYMPKIPVKKGQPPQINNQPKSAAQNNAF